MTGHLRSSLLIALLLLGSSQGATAQRQAPALPPEVRTTSAQQAWIQRHVTPQQRSELQAIARSIARDGSLRPSTKQHWEGLVTKLAQARNPIDVSALVQWVIRESYVDQTGDLRNYADKLKHFNEQKKKIRDEKQKQQKRQQQQKKKVRDERAELQGRPGPPTPRSELRRAPTKVAAPRAEVATEAQIAALDAQFQQLGDDAQLANVELQKLVQKQQQTLQMLSNIATALHDAAMAVIRKHGG